MSFRLSPPDLTDCKSYVVHQKKLAIWETIKDIPKEKRGATLAARLPYESKLKKDLRDKFFDSVDVIDLAKEGVLRLVNEFLERNLGEDDLEKQKAEAALKIVIPASVRAFMVLKRANIDRTQRMLVLSELDKSDEVNMFENMCKELKIVLGTGSGTNKSFFF